MRKWYYKIVICLLLLTWGIVIGCPVFKIFHFPCPTCGMTRAVISALKFDFFEAFNYHPLFGVLTIETLYIIFRNEIKEKIKISNTTEYIIGIITLVVLLIVWVYKQFLI